MQDERTPVWLKSLRGTSIASVAAGTAHSAAIDQGGRLLMWGQSTYGALGLGTKPRNRDVEPTPTPVDKIPAIQAISLGGLTSTAIALDGRVLTWGTDMRGSLGQGPLMVELMSPEPAPVKGLYLSQMACGWKHTVGVDLDGRLVTWGWGGAEAADYGEGEGDGEGRRPFLSEEKCSSLALGR